MLSHPSARRSLGDRSCPVKGRSRIHPGMGDSAGCWSTPQEGAQPRRILRVMRIRLRGATALAVAVVSGTVVAPELAAAHTVNGATLTVSAQRTASVVVDLPATQWGFDDV